MLFHWTIWNCTCLQDVVYLLMGDWVLKDRTFYPGVFFIWRCLTTHELLQLTTTKWMAWIFHHSTTKMDTMWRVWEQRWGGRARVASLVSAGNGCRWQKWLRKKMYMWERHGKRQLEEAMKGCSWTGWSRNQYRCFSWSLDKEMARLWRKHTDVQGS